MEAQAPDALVARIDVGRRDVGRVPLADLGPQTTDALPPRWPGHDRATRRPRHSSAAGVSAGPTPAAAPAAGVRQPLGHLAETATARAATEEVPGPATAGPVRRVGSGARRGAAQRRCYVSQSDPGRRGDPAPERVGMVIAGAGAWPRVLVGTSAGAVNATLLALSRISGLAAQLSQEPARLGPLDE